MPTIPAPVLTAPSLVPDPDRPLAARGRSRPAIRRRPSSRSPTSAFRISGAAPTPTGFDCSGLVSYVYAQLGIALPHFAAAQWLYGAPVPVDSLQPGDLVFFDKLDHVGIYLGDSLFIDAPHTGAFVRIDSLNDKWYHKKYVGARRI